MDKNKNKKQKRKHKKLYLFVGAFVVLGLLIIFVQIVSSGHFIENEIGQSAFDMFSVGHFVMGALICAPALIFLEKNRKKKGDLLFIIIIAFIFTLIISIGFEIVENSAFIVNSGLKYNNRADSTLNSNTDIVLNVFGASLLCYIYWILFKNKQKQRK